MIIEMLLNLIYTLFNLLTLPINIPSLPSSVMSYLQEIFVYIENGVHILDRFVNMGVVLSLLGIILAVDIGIGIYKFVMWIIKKIPMLSVS